MRVVATVAACVALSACAYPAQVQRFGVEYNTALAEMNNEQTLLNILRAKDGMPTHFTSVSQFRGNINLTTAASLNASLRGSGLTQALTNSGSSTTATTNTTTTTVSAPGALPGTSTVASSVVTPVSGSSLASTVVQGVDVYTPQISGQIVSGTGFDVAVFDTQKFFQGITSAPPFSTVDTLLHQGIDNRVVEFMAISQVEFRLAEPVGPYPKGHLVLSVVNDPTDKVASRKFAKFVNCYALDAGTVARSATNVVAVSRLTHDGEGKVVPLAVDKLAIIDGEKFDLSDKAGILPDPDADAQVFLTRVSAAKRVPKLSPRDPAQCATREDMIQDYTLKNGMKITIVRPTAPSPDAVYLGENQALYLVGSGLVEVPVTMDVTFRSPEGMFRYLGQYLQFDNGAVVTIDNRPLFWIAEGHSKSALAQARYRNRDYSLVNEEGSTRNAQIFTLLQQLINLHKESAERPTTIPVRAIP